MAQSKQNGNRFVSLDPTVMPCYGWWFLSAPKLFLSSCHLPRKPTKRGGSLLRGFHYTKHDVSCDLMMMDCMSFTYSFNEYLFGTYCMPGPLTLTGKAHPSPQTRPTIFHPPLNTSAPHACSQNILFPLAVSELPEHGCFGHLHNATHTHTLQIWTKSASK